MRFVTFRKSKQHRSFQWRRHTSCHRWPQTSKGDYTNCWWSCRNRTYRDIHHLDSIFRKSTECWLQDPIFPSVKKKKKVVVTKDPFADDRVSIGESITWHTHTHHHHYRQLGEWMAALNYVPFVRFVTERLSFVQRAEGKQTTRRKWWFWVWKSFFGIKRRENCFFGKCKKVND